MAFAEGFRDLKVYQLAFNLAMEIFYESKKFPAEEKYSLTDQIRRASRSVPGNIGEGYRKKRYPRMFVSKMVDADGEATETQVWLDFAHECGYLSQGRQLELREGYEEVGKGHRATLLKHRGLGRQLLTRPLTKIPNRQLPGVRRPDGALA